MFRKFGVRSVSMDDVARELSVSKKTLYQCFRDKNELISCTLETDINEVKAQVDNIRNTESNPVKQVIRIAQFIAGYIKDTNPSMIYDLQKYHPEIFEQFNNTRQKTFMDHMVQNIETGKQQGYYRPDIEAEKSAILFFCMLSNGPAAMAAANIGNDLASFYLEIMRFNLYAICSPKGLTEAKEFLQ